MNQRKIVLQYIINEYFGGNLKKAAYQSGYSAGQISKWLDGEHVPQKATIEYLIQCAFVPEFCVIAEFAQFESSKPLQTQLKAILGEHIDHPGLYAFYDSLGNLVYVGKAANLLNEISSAINRDVHISFPKGVKRKPIKRAEIVKYLSAYDVGSVKWTDFPKHVESLLLRISKPLLNKNIGRLEKAHKPPGTN